MTPKKDATAVVSGESGVADMSKAAPIADMIAMTLDTFGRLDVLVNNAGIQHVAPLEQFPIEKWDAILAINLSSAFHTTRAALPSMRKNNFGRIINIASAHGLVASPFKAAYVAAKHGIVGLTKVTALETAEANITCNAICPGYVYTPLVEAQIEGQAKVARHPARAGHSRRAARPAAEQALSPPSKSSARFQCFSQATRRPRSPARLCRWTAAGPRIETQGRRSRALGQLRI